MRLTLSTLPQLAVLAKILCLLMVVMCGAVPLGVPSDNSGDVISLFSTCSRGNVTVSTRVRTSKQSYENAPYQLLRSKTHSVVRVASERKVKLYLYAEKVGKYLCFNKKGRIVARKKTDDMCLFYETYYGRYFRYTSTEDPERILGFNKSGKPIAWPRGINSCYNFVRYKHDDGIEIHNKIKSHKKVHPLTSSPQKQQQQQQQPHLKSLHRNSNSLVQHRNQYKTRHRHEWRRQHQQQQQQQHRQQQQQQQLRPYQESKY